MAEENAIPGEIASSRRHRTSNLKLPTSNLKHPTSNLKHPTSNLKPPTSNQKGQAYLVSSFFLVGVLVLLFAVQTPTLQSDVPRNFVLENLRAELPFAYQAGVSEESAADLNRVLAETAVGFRNLALASGQTLKLHFVAFDLNASYVFGNFSGKACTYSNGLLAPVELGSTQTAIVARGTLFNDLNVTFCGKVFDLNQPLQYWAELGRRQESAIWSTAGRPT